MLHQFTYIDKSKWPTGPWQDEPDFIGWTDPSTELDCAMIRSPFMGFWCGYVGVTRADGLHGVGYNCVNPGTPYFTEEITFSDHHHSLTPGVWYFGFDCAHSRDLIPNHTVPFPSTWETEYPTAEDVRYRTERFAYEISCATAGPDRWDALIASYEENQA